MTTIINENQFLEKIGRLNNSQQSIESLSNWCTFYRKDAKKVVKLWENEFARAPDIDRQITLLYLANDILQNSRRKGPEFVNEFYHVMPRPISHLLKHGDSKVQQKVDRLVAIWDERKVFGQSGTKPFKELVTAAEAPKLPGTGAALTNGTQQQSTPAALQPLAEALSKAEAASQRSQAAAPPRQAGAATSDLQRSQQQHNTYIAALGAEAVARSGVTRLLRNLLSQQERLEARAKSQIEACRQTQQHLTARPTEAGSMSTPQSAQPDHQEDEYSPTANMGDEDPWEAAAAEPAAPPQPPEEAGAQPPPPGHSRDPQGSLEPPQPTPRQHMTAGNLGAPPPDSRRPDGDAAALAVQLAAAGDSALKLQQILANLPMEQQQAISAGLSSFAQPQLHEEHEEDGAAGEDEYDPEDADMQLGF
ncbi:hypothetical protein CVIRNUC_008981 [Coccomyxa viridis]|uniref:CID domain-containing protein n=1 Tax=Coccomyxa viridis TaxID=1274662 RepID=A0AAV1IH39_9CHLO|nr:hypothetical protein CVIRNUC_008981 [Coccomyxa viridis]